MMTSLTFDSKMLFLKSSELLTFLETKDPDHYQKKKVSGSVRLACYNNKFTNLSTCCLFLKLRFVIQNKLHHHHHQK